jgi:hypothetical protein
MRIIDLELISALFQMRYKKKKTNTMKRNKIRMSLLSQFKIYK